MTGKRKRANGAKELIADEVEQGMIIFIITQADSPKLSFPSGRYTSACMASSLRE